MTKKEEKTLDKVECLISEARDDLFTAFDTLGCEEEDAKLPKKELRKVRQTLEKACKKLTQLLDS